MQLIYNLLVFKMKYSVVYVPDVDATKLTGMIQVFPEFVPDTYSTL